MTSFLSSFFHFVHGFGSCFNQKAFSLVMGTQMQADIFGLLLCYRGRCMNIPSWLKYTLSYGLSTDIDSGTKHHDHILLTYLSSARAALASDRVPLLRTFWISVPKNAPSIETSHGAEVIPTQNENPGGPQTCFADGHLIDMARSIVNHERTLVSPTITGGNT